MKKFAVELNISISEKDTRNLRNLYTPIIGTEASALYLAFLDYQKFSKNVASYIPFKELEKLLREDSLSLQKSRTKLEAVGLIRTFEKADNVNFLIAMNAPLNVTQFRKNTLLFNLFIDQVDESTFERFEYLERNSKFNKDDFSEVSAKFQDIFDINTKPKSNKIENTLELSNVAKQTVEESIKGMTPVQFVLLITEKKITNAVYSTVSHLQNLGMKQSSINEIINYSFKVNGKVVSNHISVIGNDMVVKEKTTHNEVKAELFAALNSKTTIEAKEEEKKPASKGELLEWDELFDSIGGDL